MSNPQTLERVRGLVIPPAWREVWICTDPAGHLQATGIDAAGRKQYLYHPAWRERRDREKFDTMIRFASALPRLRRRVSADLGGGDDGLTRARVLACAARLLDLGLFRIGSEEYAENGGGLGLTTLTKRHVSLGDGRLTFDYPAKGGGRRVHSVEDPLCEPVVRALKRRRGGTELLAVREQRRWAAVRSDDVNAYLKQHMGEDFSAKDFRTWSATTLAAHALSHHGRDATTKTARVRAMNVAVREVAEMLGNTPAVARRAYIDPRVFDRYLSGWLIAPAYGRARDWESIAGDARARGRLERAVLDLLTEHTDSPALESASAHTARARRTSKGSRQRTPAARAGRRTARQRSPRRRFPARARG